MLYKHKLANTTTIGYTAIIDFVVPGFLISIIQEMPLSEDLKYLPMLVLFAYFAACGYLLNGRSLFQWIFKIKVVTKEEIIPTRILGALFGISYIFILIQSIIAIGFTFWRKDPMIISPILGAHFVHKVN